MLPSCLFGKPFQIVLVILICISNAHSKGSPWDWQMSRYPSSSNPPKIVAPETETQAITKNITAVVGQTALLPCRTLYLKEHNTVSWIKGRDTSVLSVGRHAFSSDKRISVATTNPPLARHEADWTLQIGVVTPRDEGWYECQINTEPKISNISYLNIQSLNNEDNNRSLQDAPQLQQVIPQIQEFLSNALPPRRQQPPLRNSAVNGHSSHERQNAFNRITLDRRDERPIALPQLEPPDGGGSTGNGNADEEQEKDLVSRVQSLETRIAKLEDRLESMVSLGGNLRISYLLTILILSTYCFVRI